MTVKLGTVPYITAHYTYMRVNMRIIIDPRNAYCIVLTLYYYTYKLLDIKAILSPTSNDEYEHRYGMDITPRMKHRYGMHVPPRMDPQHG